MTNGDAKFTRRINMLLQSAVTGLDPADRADRIAWCQERNQHGVTMHPSNDDDLLEFRWGGKRLVMIHRDDLLSEKPLHPEFIADVPDSVPDELSLASRFTPNQRSLMFLLAVGAWAEKTGSDTETAADQLDKLPMTIEGDQRDIVLGVDGETLIRAPRQWLASLDGAGSGGGSPS